MRPRSLCIYPVSSVCVRRFGKFCFNNSDCGSRNVPRSHQHHVNLSAHASVRSACAIDLNGGSLVRCSRPNGSLGILGKTNGQHSTVGAAAYAPAPIRRGGIFRFIYLGGPTGRPFSWELFATIPLMNDESLSTLFRVGKKTPFT